MRKNLAFVILAIVVFSASIHLIPKITNTNDIKTSGMDGTTNTEKEPSIPILDENGKTDSKRAYKSTDDFPLGTLDFANEEAFLILKEAYENIDFYGEFEKGDMKVYEYYREKFLQLVKNESPFLNKETGKEFYLKEFGDLKEYGNIHIYDVKKLTFYFFDMDEDRTPELCIRGDSGFTYIFKYVSDKNEFVLWKELPVSYYQLNGSNKIRWDGAGGSDAGHVFYKLNKDGQEEYTVYFFSKLVNDTDQSEEIYMLGLPHYINGSESMNISKAIKEQACFDESHEVYYFRVTADQYDDTISSYRRARDLSKEAIKEVTYTYDELFGTIIQ